MPWHATLQLNYQLQSGRSVLHHVHNGPLRILKSLYPEGDGVCHNVIVHPPGGLVGGDELDIQVHVGRGAHGLISTPGATRFYASDDLAATQRVTVELEENARLDWMPLESIAFPGCAARNQWSAKLARGAELLACDVTALGLPSAGQAFNAGYFHQRLEIPGIWLEQAHIDSADTRLLDSPLGLGGQRCIGTLLLACGTELTRQRRERLLETVQSTLADATSPHVQVGVTCPNPHMLVVRAVAPLVEPLMACLHNTWTQLRPAAWGISGAPPRIWSV